MIAFVTPVRISLAPQSQETPSFSISSQCQPFYKEAVASLFLSVNSASFGIEFFEPEGSFF